MNETSTGSYVSMADSDASSQAASQATLNATSEVKAEASRLGYLIPAVLILGLAGTVTYISYTQEPADAFLFPRLISTVMFILAVWNFVRAAMGKSKVGQGIALKTWLRIVPGILLMAAFIFFAAKYFGFYVASTVVFFLMYSGYDPNSHLSPKSWLRRILVTVVFMAIIYALFALLLKVQTPRGIYL